MSSYTTIGIEIGELVDRKNAAYGSSFDKCGDFLRLLWPEGLPADRFDDALLMARIFDKQMRIATDRDAFGESPYRDIAGYGLLGAAKHERNGKCGSVSEDAESRSKAAPASAAPDVKRPTTTIDESRSAMNTLNESSQQPKNLSESAESKDASAHAATAGVPGSAAAPEKLEPAANKMLGTAPTGSIYSVACPACAAQPGYLCLGADYTVLFTTYHIERVTAYQFDLEIRSAKYAGDDDTLDVTEDVIERTGLVD